MQTFSDGSVPWRNWCDDLHRGKEPSGENVSSGEVVRWSSSEPRDAQKSPASAFRSPFQRWSMLWLWGQVIVLVGLWYGGVWQQTL